MLYVCLSVHPSVCPSDTNIVRTTQKLLVRFHPDFTGMIRTKSSSSYAYCQYFQFNDFCHSYGPLMLFYWMIFRLSYGPWKKILVSKSTLVTNFILSWLQLTNYRCDIIQTMQEWSVPSLVHIVSIFSSVIFVRVVAL